VTASSLLPLLKCFLPSHLSAHYIALDANFRHKRKARDGDGDPGFTRGAGYFVEPRLFAEELARIQDKPQAPEKPTCESSFAAIERADSRVNKGFSVTGIVAAIDARHGFLLANGVVDLQKGERYVIYFLSQYKLIRELHP
jgi:hypothetical protein